MTRLHEMGEFMNNHVVDKSGGELNCRPVEMDLGIAPKRSPSVTKVAYPKPGGLNPHPINPWPHPPGYPVHRAPSIPLDYQL